MYACTYKNTHVGQVFIGVSAVLALQIRCICANLTVNEYHNYRRYFLAELRPKPPNRCARAQ